MNCHPLVKLAYMLHRVCIAVVNGEGWLLESLGERSSFNTASLVTLLLMGESLAWGGPGPLLVVVIIFVTERCVCARGGGIVFVVQSAAFSSSHLSLTAGLVRHPISGTCDYPHGYGFCWFASCLHSLLETFRSLHSGHAQGLGNYPAAGIWLAQADGSVPCGGLIPPCSIVVLTSTQVLPIDCANCRVYFWEVLHCRCE